MRQWYGIHKQAAITVQASASGIMLPSVTVSYYGALTYAAIGWNGASVGAYFTIKEVDASATASLSNTVWRFAFNTTYGSAFLTFGEEGLKASDVATTFRLAADTSGSVYCFANGFISRTNV